MQRTPLITVVSDSIANKQKNTILSAYAIGKMFTGITEASLDLNTYATPGIIRIDNDATNGPDNVNPKGFLHITAINNDEDASADANKYIIRQVLYPDSSEFNIQTRTGLGASIVNPTSTIVWSDWAEMGGGGFLKRVELTESMTGATVALPNIMYYSYHNYILQLPDPNNFRLGTRIGLEQLENDRDEFGAIVETGHVTYGDKDQPTSADYEVIVEEDGSLTTTSVIVGSLIYYFTVAEEDEDSSDKIWVLEISTNYNDYINTVNARLSAHMSAADPHERYLLRTDLTNTIDQTIDKAVTPKGVTDALAGISSSLGNDYVTKSAIYTNPENGIVKVERLPEATDSAKGVSRLATAADIENNIAGIITITPQQLNTRRLQHHASWKTDTVSNSNITEDLKTKNPLYTLITGKTIQLPTPTAALASRSATVYVDLIKGNDESIAQVTVICAAVGLSEVFSHKIKNSTLHLVFEAGFLTSSTYTWKLVL